MPFETPEDRQEHFDKHKREPGMPATPAAYEAKADNFMAQPLDFLLVEGPHILGGTARLSLLTDEFCVVGQNGFIVTYFIANPAIHGMARNLDYFHSWTT